MLYRPDVCNCTMPYVHRTVPAVCRTGPCLDSRSGRSYTSETRVILFLLFCKIKTYSNPAPTPQKQKYFVPAKEKSNFDIFGVS